MLCLDATERRFHELHWVLQHLNLSMRQQVQNLFVFGVPKKRMLKGSDIMISRPWIAMTSRWSNVSLVTLPYMLPDISVQSHLRQKYFLNWQRRKWAPLAAGEMQCGSAADWRFRRRSKIFGSFSDGMSDDNFIQITAGYPSKHWWGRQGPIPHWINKGILPWSRHSYKKELTHSRSRQLTFSRLPQTVETTPGRIHW